jgi:hypothetical protein
MSQCIAIEKQLPTISSSSSIYDSGLDFQFELNKAPKQH